MRKLKPIRFIHGSVFILKNPMAHPQVGEKISFRWSRCPRMRGRTSALTAVPNNLPQLVNTVCQGSSWPGWKTSISDPPQRSRKEVKMKDLDQQASTPNSEGRLYFAMRQNQPCWSDSGDQRLTYGTINVERKTKIRTRKSTVFLRERTTYLGSSNMAAEAVQS